MSLCLTLTCYPQEPPGARIILAFDLLYAQTQLTSLGLPVGFYHFVARNYSGYF
jgi:hypothetical protein